MIELYTSVTLKDGQAGIVVDYLGSDYIVDIGSSQADWETILVHPEDINGEAT